MATTIATQSTTIKRIVHDPSRNRVLLISASGVDIYRVTDWTRLAWAALANVTCGAFNNNGIYLGTSDLGTFRLPLTARGAATGLLQAVFNANTAIGLSSYNIADIAGHGSALALVTASEFVYLPNPATAYAGPTDATGVAMNGTYLAWTTASSVEIATIPTADFSTSDTSIGDTANRLAFEAGTNNLLICHADGLRLVDCADPGAAGGEGLPTDGLVAHWTMDAVSGTSLFDDSGKGHNGTISGATQATGSIGKALDFDGSNDQISIASHADFNHGGAFSISLRFKTSDSTNRQALFWKNPTGAAGFWCRIEPADNRIRAYVYDGTDGCMLATTQHYCDGEEHHLNAVFDGSTFKLLIDGTEAASGDASAVGDWSNTDPLYLGRSSAAGDWMHGWIDEFRFYNRALTTDETTALKDQTDPVVPRAGLVSHYTMDAISGTTVYDEAGTNNGTVTGAVQVDGAIGKALWFDGINDKVVVTAPGTADLTVSLFATFEVDDDNWLANRRASTSTGKQWQLIHFDGNIYVQLFDGSTKIGEALYEWTPDSERHHLAFTTSGTSGGDLDVYLDGVLVATDTLTAAWSVDAGVDLVLGQRGWTDVNGHHKGTIDNYRSYNRALSAAEIAALYTEATNPMPRAGLVSHWPMNSINGTTLLDEEGANNGTIVGATQAEGVVGSAMDLDGDTDHISVAHSASLEPTTITLAGWFFPDTWGANTLGHNALFCKRGISGNGYLLFRHNTFDELQIDIGGSAYRMETGYLPPTGKWTHLAVTFDGTTTKFYVNGALEFSAEEGNSATIPSGQELTIGTQSTDHTYGFDGKIDAARIYDRALTTGEIAILYSEGVGGFGTNYDTDLGTVTACQAAHKQGDYLAYGTSDDADGGRFGILLLDAEGAATSKNTVAATDTDAVWLNAGATEAIYNNQLERYRLVAELSPGAGGRDVRRDWVLYAEITDSLGGIESGTVTLKVNGASQTPTTAAITNGYSVKYTPGGNSGYGERVTIEISGTDADGNTVSRSWAFTTASAPALTVTDAAPPNVTCIRDISLAAAEADETVDSVNVIWIDTVTSPLIVTEAQAKERGRVEIDGQTYHRHKVGVKVLAADAGDLQTRDLRQGGIATITCDALGMSAQKCEILAAQRVIDDGAEDISFNLQAAYYEAVS